MEKGRSMSMQEKRLLQKLLINFLFLAFFQMHAFAQMLPSNKRRVKGKQCGRKEREDHNALV